MWKLSPNEAMGAVIKDVQDLQIEMLRAVYQLQEFIAHRAFTQKLTNCFLQGVERGLSVALNLKQV